MYQQGYAQQPYGQPQGYPQPQAQGYAPQAPLRMSQQVLAGVNAKLVGYELVTEKYNQEKKVREATSPHISCKFLLPDGSNAFIRLFLTEKALRYAQEKADRLGIGAFFQDCMAMLQGGGADHALYSKPSNYKPGGVDWELSNPQARGPRAQEQAAGFAPPTQAPQPQVKPGYAPHEPQPQMAPQAGWTPPFQYTPPQAAPQAPAPNPLMQGWQQPEGDQGGYEEEQNIPF